jgi:hypothetical protein
MREFVYLEISTFLWDKFSAVFQNNLL